MSPATREQMRKRASRLNGVREVRRPEAEHTPAFCLAYVRNGDVARIVYEFAGPELLTRLLRAYAAGRASWTWRRIAQLNRNDTDRVVGPVRRA